ncbi:hypothetical protein [Psychroserpens mesophilus]|uniref:hypothetical protein n=1 Tax=Psychroserpens mesophilus TaxID=325473 RepID=UPI003D64C2B8
MAPVKFEDKLKDKLENRKLQPSTDAWSTLADRLDKADRKNNNTIFWWLGIAASIVGVIFVTTQFFNTTEDVKDIPVVVDTKTKPLKKPDVITKPSANTTIVVNSDENKNNFETVNAAEVNSVYNDKTDEKQKAIYHLKKPHDVVVALDKNKQDVDDNVPVKTLTHEALKIIEVVDVIKQLQANENLVSDQEIDSLLKQAQREILKQRIFDETTRTVDADALLQDVEGELEQSFRDKVFEALKSSYKSVKTAVAERRN